MKKRVPTSSKRRQVLKLAAVAGLTPLVLERLTPHALAASHIPDQVVLPTDVILYNADNGSVITGQVNIDGTFTPYHSYPAGAFAPGWTIMVMAGNGMVFAYNASTGEGATVSLDATGGIIAHQYYPAGTFALNWTNIIPIRENELVFYNSADGSAMIATVNSLGIFTSIIQIPAGTFTPAWTDIVTGE